jgi:anaerobic selenocysteine-containing dehydrogenase
MTGCSRATRRQAARARRPAARERDASRRRAAPVGDASRCPTAAAPCRCSADRRALLSDEYAPEKVAPATAASRPRRSRRIAAELADAAFEQQIELDVPGPTGPGRTTKTMIGRPVSMHAMRGISAHSNGFQTCRACICCRCCSARSMCPGGFRYKPPFRSRAAPNRSRPASLAQVAAGTPLPGAPLGFPQGPEDLLVDADGAPQRIDKAYSWDAPLAAHGLMHMVIPTRRSGDPYPIDVLFMYMANMAGTRR